MSDERHFIEKVVGPETLYNETAVGWEVVERFDHDALFEIQEPVTAEMRQGGYYQGTYARAQLGRVSSFRIRRTVDSPIAALTEEVMRLTQGQRAADDEKKKAEEALAAEKRDHHGTKADLRRAQEYTEETRKQREQIEAIKHQLERDLGKVREHIGRKLFDEILPPQPAKSQEGSA